MLRSELKTMPTVLVVVELSTFPECRLGYYRIESRAQNTLTHLLIVLQQYATTCTCTCTHVHDYVTSPAEKRQNAICKGYLILLAQ